MQRRIFDTYFCDNSSDNKTWNNMTQKENRSYNYGHWITKQAYWKTKIKQEDFGSNRQVEKKDDSYYLSSNIASNK